MEVEAIRNINGVKVVIKSDNGRLLMPDITTYEKTTTLKVWQDKTTKEYRVTSDFKDYFVPGIPTRKERFDFIRNYEIIYLPGLYNDDPMPDDAKYFDIAFYYVDGELYAEHVYTGLRKKMEYCPYRKRWI